MFSIIGEDDYGPIEYKRQLTSMTNTKINKYATQMKFRLIEGNGEAIYMIGVKDNGDIIGVENKNYLLYCKLMSKIAREINSRIILIELIGSEIKYMKFTIKSNFRCDSIFNF
jgi:elongation factor 1-alpha